MDKDQELLIENSKKSLFWQRLRTVLVGIVAALLLVGTVLFIVEVRKIDQVTERVNTIISQELDVESINKAVDSLTGAADRLAELDTDSINELVKGLDNATSSLSKVVDGLKLIFGKK